MEPMPAWNPVVAVLVGGTAAVSLWRTRAGPDLPARIFLSAAWTALCAAAASLLTAWGDASGLVLTAAALPLALVEAWAMADVTGGDTYSERAHWWLGKRPARLAVLAALGALLLAHWWAGWP